MCSNRMDLSWMRPRSTDPELHVTIQNGGPIQLAKCVQCCTKYHCPFCKPEIFKPTVESKVRKHIKAHEKRAVRFKEYAIFKCGLNCKATKHFHCPKCSKLVEKRNKFLEHLVKCVGTVAHEDRENLVPLKEKPDLVNLSVKVDMDSCHMSDGQEHQSTVLGEQLHVTIQNGGPIPLEKCVQCCTKYHCPFCNPDVFKPTVESKVRKHIKAHEKRAVRFKEYIIFKCGLNCRTISHFHCPNCCKLWEKKNRFVDHLNKCMGAVMAEDGGHHLSVKQEADRHHVPENVENHPAPEANISFEEETIPTQLSTYSNVEEKSWREAVKSLQASQETSIFKSSEVTVSIQCLLELFQFCWLCHEECCITIEGNDELFRVTQDCQSCSYHRDWRSRPPSVEPTQSFHDEEENIPEDEEVFIEQDGSYLSCGGDEASLQEEKKKRKRKSDSSDEWEPCLDEEATDSDVSMDEDLFTALKEDDEGKPVVWCTQCGTQASLSCSVLQHKKVFCCSQCRTGDNIQTHNCETLPVCFDDVASFQTHVEQEHGARPFSIQCQDCGKLIRTKKEHVCEHKSKLIVCPDCGKRFLTEVGLKTHYNQLHSDYDHPCKYCLKVFKTKSEKLDHEQTHRKETQPYSCPDCPQTFDDIHKRNKHVESH